MKMKKVFAVVVLGITVLALAGFEGAYAAEEGDASPAGVLSTLFGEGGPLQDVFGEGGLLQDVFGEGGLLQDVLGEGTDIGAAIGSAKEYVSELAGQFIGIGDLDPGSVEDEMTIYQCLNEAEEAFIIEHNADLLDQADVQFVSNNHIYTDHFDVDPIRSVNYMIEYTFRADEENRLWFVSGASDVVLFRHSNNLEGGCPVTEASFSEDGEQFMPSIEAMCEEVGIPVDEAMEIIDFADIMVIIDLQQYLMDHPEYAGLEYNGEIRSAEELDELYYERLSELNSADS